MLKLVITAKARSDLNSIVANVVEYTGFPCSGVKLVNDLFKTFQLLTEIPRAGQALDDGTRQTFCRKYCVIYQIVNE